MQLATMGTVGGGLALIRSRTDSDAVAFSCWAIPVRPVRDSPADSWPAAVDPWGAAEAGPVATNHAAWFNRRHRSPCSANTLGLVPMLLTERLMSWLDRTAVESAIRPSSTATARPRQDRIFAPVGLSEAAKGTLSTFKLVSRGWMFRATRCSTRLCGVEGIFRLCAGRISTCPLDCKPPGRPGHLYDFLVAALPRARSLRMYGLGD